MNIKTIMILMVAMIVTTACSSTSIDNSVDKKEQATSVNIVGSDPKTINLRYTSVPKEKLHEGQPNANWIKGKSIHFDNLPQKIESTIHLYIEGDTSNDGMIHGFLEHEGKNYDLEIVGCYGLEDVEVSLVDRTSDELKEIQIIGGMGATYAEMKVIGYNSKDQEWFNLLSMGTPNIVDLNGDGQDELVAISTGSLPSFVDIYKWNVDHFERASITESTGNTYAFLSNEGGSWVIVSGKWVDGQNASSQYYGYDADCLIEIEEHEKNENK